MKGAVTERCNENIIKYVMKKIRSCLSGSVGDMGAISAISLTQHQQQQQQRVSVAIGSDGTPLGWYARSQAQQQQEWMTNDAKQRQKMSHFYQDGTYGF